jgi:hypothetical protein
MRRLVALIGTSHLYQFGGAARTERQNQAFEELIRQTCQAHGIRCLAEEMSLDALKAQARMQSTVKMLAHSLSLDHIYCDPSEQEQTAMGLQVERNAGALKHFEQWNDERIAEGIAAEHRQRERYWLTKLLEKDIWPCLFICGSEHAVHFRSLLETSAVHVALLAEVWDA